ncbi:MULTISPECIES: PilZ domain-containing protein [unclassified Bradyrhizobium]|uniref:PilZ domain-containing protein n=1 Tax=unclassified Bradyrhizobium TaxID=2631580 RepID=UPI0020B230F4|nr:MULTISPECIES: PilZ domain-containing protein [unclassified Bradyrhizobium]MCP3401888.1 PilZ domain-containing protein [Bradyrhizobium sp. CCGB20]MCP3410373.1 PilZ domain-containing protein [Bradyrhizobium sp. CCGB01]
MMAIDGTWRPPCAVETISEEGARLTLEVSIESLSLTEFFLVLSSTGLAYRSCELDGVNGAEITVKFLRARDRRKERSGTRNAPA